MKHMSPVSQHSLPDHPPYRYTNKVQNRALKCPGTPARGVRAESAFRHVGKFPVSIVLAVSTMLYVTVVLPVIMVLPVSIILCHFRVACHYRVLYQYCVCVSIVLPVSITLYLSIA